MAALPLAAGPREGRAMVSYFPMPFRSRARIAIENDTGRQIDAFYYYVDYEQVPSPSMASLGQAHRTPFPDREARKLRPAIGPSEIHRWRDAWRKSMGSGRRLWGDERPPQ